eukprot:958018-Rhodomonas_salina.4
MRGAGRFTQAEQELTRIGQVVAAVCLRARYPSLSTLDAPFCQRTRYPYLPSRPILLSGCRKRPIVERRRAVLTWRA